VTSPLYWMTAVRPMSDSVGLAAALAAQALLATAFVRQFNDIPDTRGRYDPAIAARSGRVILLGALVAGLAIGVRSQALWLTVPLLLVVLVSRAGRGAAGALIGSTVWFTVGVLAWLVPLVVASGGPAAYLAALGSQAGEDWTGVDLLITRPSIRRLAQGLLDTLVVHWAGLGWIVLACAAAGAAFLVLRRRKALGILVAAFAPYAVFHLLFQESVTTRYALPLVAPVVYLAVRGAWLLGAWPARVAAAACVVVALVQVVPVTVAYSREGSPVSHAIADVRAEAARAGSATLGRHFSFARALEADLDDRTVRVIRSAPRQAWQDLGRYLVDEGRPPLWVFETPRHAELALVDPSSLMIRHAYRWPFDAVVFLGGVRPSDVDWVEFRNPGWVASEGWYLTPDTAGIAAASGQGLGLGPIKAFVRTRPGAAAVMVGGRHLGQAADAPLVFTLRLGDHELESWTVTPAAPFFLRFMPVPAGALAGAGPWLPLTIEARGAGTGQHSGLGAIEQFDVQDAARLMVGYGAGWQEQELNPATGVRWRWTSERADLRVYASGQDVILRLAGESPLRTFDRPSRVTLRVGSRTLLDQSVSADFEWTVQVPGADLVAAGGVVTVSTDQTFRPADRGENADRRSLGLRVFSATVTPAS